MNAPRLALLVGYHRSARSLIPGLQQSRFLLAHHCLEAEQLQEAIDAGAVDVALVTTGPRGLDPVALVRQARQIPLVVLDPQPHHQRWANFPGVVLAADASIELALSGLEAALRGESLRQPIERSDAADTLQGVAHANADEPNVELPEATSKGGGCVTTVVGGDGAPGRSILALNLAVLLGRVAATVLVDADLAAPVLAARLGANTNKNLVTVAHTAPVSPDDWTAVLGRDLQAICPGTSTDALLLAGLPRTDSQLAEGFLDGLLEALRARFDYVVCDMGVRWLDGDRIARVPLQAADTLLVAVSPETAGIPRARHVLETARHYVGDVKTGIVVNQYRAQQDFDRWDYEFAFGEPISALLPFDPQACWRAADQKRPVVVLERRSPLTKSLVHLAERLHGGQIELPRPTAERRSPWQWPAWFWGKAS
jgi:pilus assembly protein CpaE